jgi:nitroreductase
MNDVMNLMQTHSSVRAYTNEAIDEELLQKIIACGQAAASSSFIQAYSLVRVRDINKRRRIAEVAGGQVWVEEAAEFLVLCADMQRINYASRKSGQGELQGYAEHFLAASIDTALMAQNMMLAAESCGLGCVFIGGIRNDPQVLVNLLEIPKHVYPTFGFCLGWPAHKNAVKPRLPVSSILHEDRYDLSKVAVSVDEYDKSIADYYETRAKNTKSSDWSAPTTRAIQGKRREHMLAFLQSQGFLKC